MPSEFQKIKFCVQIYIKRWGKISSEKCSQMCVLSKMITLSDGYSSDPDYILQSSHTANSKFNLGIVLEGNEE